ncbi:MAG: 50S ribosomal protein L11 methyltransferase [Alphaproteobacteria bacterium]|nr:50S ribosomal protein L11 methyltransferase [Alphaproteobacteria bacterium]
MVRAPFDLITENVLAGPISGMAPDLMAHLAPGGVAVLSGILADQENQVLASHGDLRLGQRIPLGEWVTLVLGG